MPAKPELLPTNEKSTLRQGVRLIFYDELKSWFSSDFEPSQLIEH